MSEHLPLALIQEWIAPYRGAAYGLLMLAAMACGFLLTRRTQSRLAVDRWQRWGLLLGAFCGAMIGAKLPFALSDWRGFLSGAAWFANGKTIVFGLVGGYFGVEIAKWLLGVRVKTGDTFAVPVAASVACGRLACFVGGCCYGAPTGGGFGVVFPHVDGQLRHPTQLYEASFHAAAAITLWQLERRGLFRGRLIILYILAYLGYRFLSEFIRPEPRIYAGLTGYQAAALALAPLFVYLWLRDAAKARRANAVAAELH